MKKFTNEELLEVLPTNIIETKELTTKQKIILAQLVIYNGLEQTKKNGFFYRSNKDLMNDCGVSEPTLIASLKKLESVGFIERKSGVRGKGASEYKVHEEALNNDLKCNFTKNFSNQDENFSTDKEIDIDKEKKNINNNLNIKNNMNSIECIILKLIESNNKIIENNFEIMKIILNNDIEKMLNGYFSISKNIDTKTDESRSETGQETSKIIYDSSTDVVDESCSSIETEKIIETVSENEVIAKELQSLSLENCTNETIVNETVEQNFKEMPMVYENESNNVEETALSVDDIVFGTEEGRKTFQEIGVWLEKLEKSRTKAVYKAHLNLFKEWLVKKGVDIKEVNEKLIPNLYCYRAEFMNG